MDPEPPSPDQIRRLALHARLKAISGVKDAYFQPPDGKRMEYPCIVYTRDDTYKRHANNNPFMMESRYELTVMDTNPDSPIFKAVEMFPKCRINRVFEREQLNHQVFNLYF